MKMPDFNMKKLVKEAGSTLSRVVQVCTCLHTQLSENLLINLKKRKKNFESP